MKSTLLIIFLLPLTVVGQDTSTKNRFIKLDKSRSSFIGQKGDTLLFDVPVYIDSVENNYDTIPAIMLVSDSSTPNNNKVVWIKGWEVREKILFSSAVAGNRIYHEGIFKHIEYLDIIKNKLSRNIIVWQSKNY